MQVAGQEGAAEFLVVDQDDVLTRIIAKALHRDRDARVHTAHDAAEARRAIARHWRHLDLAVCDVAVPGGERGEVIQHLASSRVPCLVYCDSATPQQRSALFGMKVIDVIQKEGPASLEYLTTTVERLLRNRRHTALVVDPQAAHRRLMAKLLERYQFNVLETADAQHALEIIDEIPKITLAVIECRMTGITGIELTKKLRARHAKEDLAIVGCGSFEDIDLLPKMLKAGANDIFKKPFTDEEFYCRACNAVEMIDNIHAIKLAAVTDFLSGLYNRRHLFAEGARFRDRLLSSGRLPVVGMADIDFFKRINDTFGHDAGDLVIKMVAGTLREQVGEKGMAARVGGEEFCLLVSGDKAEAEALFEDLRQRIAALEIQYKGERIPVTSSIGVSVIPGQSLDHQITDADKALYAAKQSGRNRVVLHGPDGERILTQ